VVHDIADTVNEVAGGGTDEVRTVLNTYTLDANVENLTFDGAGNFVGNGNLLANVITGGAGNDALDGGLGNDVVHGGSGNDALDGGTGDDVLDGGIGNDNLDGGLGDDALAGGDGVDTLTGGVGNDTLNGGRGNDVLDGGPGSDVFVFAPSFGADRIADFDANPAGGQDLIDVRALGITAANFAASVTIAIGNFDGVGGLDTLLTIGADSITLSALNGAGPNAITQADFLLA
jgi:Ca2+-binding RTX toxin-like protein